MWLLSHRTNVFLFSLFKVQVMQIIVGTSVNQISMNVCWLLNHLIN